jgi:cbb3-type cytochrome oxidase subunit 3
MTRPASDIDRSAIYWSWHLALAICFVAVGIHWGLTVLDIKLALINRFVVFSLCVLFLLAGLYFAFRRQWKNLGLSFLAPASYLLVVWFSSMLTSDQILEARRRGDAIDTRILVYAEKIGKFPEDFAALSFFDGEEIPQTGIGFFGNQHSSFQLDSYGGTLCILSFREFKGEVHSRHAGLGWRTNTDIHEFVTGMSTEERERFINSSGTDLPARD